MFEQQKNLKNFLSKANERHPFYIPQVHPAPFLLSVNTLLAVVASLDFLWWTDHAIYTPSDKWLNNEFSIWSWLHLESIIKTDFLLSWTSVIFWFAIWLKIVENESVLIGGNTKAVRISMKEGLILYLFSELLIFLSFFVTFFVLVASPNFFVGFNMPSKFVLWVNPFGLPALNTILLILSGYTITKAHEYCGQGRKKEALTWFIWTVFLGVIFLISQWIEYELSPFVFTDSALCAIFYLATGFHGLHVFIGLVFILLLMYRLIANNTNTSTDESIGLWFTIWYWHFVDIIWIFLYIIFYVWP